MLGHPVMWAGRWYIKLFGNNVPSEFLVEPRRRHAGVAPELAGRLWLGEQFRLGSILPTHLKISKRDDARNLALGGAGFSLLHPAVDVGTGKPRDKQYEVLRELIQTLNELYGVGLAEEDKVDDRQLMLGRFGNDLLKLAVETDAEQTAVKVKNNSEAQFLEASDIPETIKEMIVDATDVRREYNDKEKKFYDDVGSRLLSDPLKLAAVADALAKAVYRYFAQDQPGA